MDLVLCRTYSTESIQKLILSGYSLIYNMRHVEKYDSLSKRIAIIDVKQ